MADFQMDWLRNFVAVVDTGSITAAAREVSRSQSAVSMQLKKLEDTVGQTLLNRGPRHLSLTPTGLDLLKYARELVALHAQAQIAMHGKKVTGKVRFGVPDDYVGAYCAPLLRAFANQFSDIDIALVCEPSSMLLPKIDRGDIDLALVTRNTALRSNPQSGHFLFYEPLVWVASEAHEVWRKNPLPLALHEFGSRFRTEILNSLGAQERDYRVVYSSTNVLGQLAMVEAGLAVAVITECSVPNHLQILDDSYGLPSLPKMEVALVRSPDSLRSAAVAALYQEVLRMLSNAA